MSKRNKRGSAPRRRPRTPRERLADHEYRQLRDAAATRAVRRKRMLAVIGVVAIVAVALSLFYFASPAKAAEPAASAGIGDVRSATAPGLAGDPLFAVGGVLLVAVLAVGATLLYVRLTARR
jgi:hypothetical protein